MENNGEYSNFSYVSQKLHFDADKIKLMTKIYNRDSSKSDLLSLVWTSTDDQCYAFGHNGSGCLGLNQTTTLQFKKPTKIRALSGIRLIKLCSGHRFVLALTDQGKCYSWGDNKFGQLGLAKSVSHIAKPMLIDSIENRIVDVACGLHHSLVLTESYHLYSFGSNLTGAVGNGTTFHQFKPVQITNFADSLPFSGADFVEIACGGWHSAAVNLKGQLFVWGWNQTGQCASEDLKSNILTPTRIAEKFLVRSVRCGQHHTLFLLYNGQVMAVGSNQHGQCCQDVTLVHHCCTPVLVQLDEPVNEIGAWAKSDLSVARSATSGAFFLWGPMEASKISKSNVIENQNPPLIRKIPSGAYGSILNQYNHRTINWVMGKFETSKFSDDNKLLSNLNHENWFPFKRILIQNSLPDVNDKCLTNGLMETFNNPNECDLIFSFVAKRKVPIMASSAHGWMIFVQRILLERYSDFFQLLPKSWIIEESDCESTSEVDSNRDWPSSEQNENDLQEGLEYQHLKMQTQVLTVNRQRKRFQRLVLDATMVSERALYAYLLFIYSSQKYLIMGQQDLIELLRLAESIQDAVIVDCCLRYIVSSNSSCLEQICSLYCQAVQYQLKSVQDFCCQMIRSVLKRETDSIRENHPDVLDNLYNGRKETYDLEMRFQYEEQSIKCHKLVLFAGSNFYHTILHNRTSLFVQEILDKNQMRQESEQELMLLNTIDLNIANSHAFDFQTFDLYIYHIYYGRFPYDHMTLGQLVDLFHLANIMDEALLLNEIIQLLGPRIQQDNVCQFYSQYCQATDAITIEYSLDILKEICMEKASSDLVKLLCGQDFYHYILLMENDNNNTGNLLRNFIFDLSKYLKTNILAKQIK